MKNEIRYLLFRMMIGLCDILPQRLCYSIAIRVADLNFFYLDDKGRKRVEKNLRQVIPYATENRISKEARWIFRNFAKYLTEFFRFRHFDKQYFQTHMALFGLEHVDQALARGKGCIVSSVHLSNWELGAAALSIMGGKTFTVSVAMHRYGKINELFMRERRAAGLKVADMEKNAAHTMLRALRRNEVVGVMGDRDPTAQGVVINFFGKPCRFPQGPARLAIATGAPVIPAFCIRRCNDSFTTTFHPPIYPPEDGDKEEKVRRMTQEFADIASHYIRLHPEQWAVFYDCWEDDWQPE